MRLVINHDFSQRKSLSARMGGAVRSAISHALTALQSAWTQAFPVPPLGGPDAPPTISKSAALREGALLAEDIEAKSDRHVA
jgi:hypothetical protein